MDGAATVVLTYLFSCMLTPAKGRQMGEIRWLKLMGNGRVMMAKPIFQVYNVLTSVAYLDPSYHFDANRDLNPILSVRAKSQYCRYTRFDIDGAFHFLNYVDPGLQC